MKNVIISILNRLFPPDKPIFIKDSNEKTVDSCLLPTVVIGHAD